MIKEALADSLGLGDEAWSSRLSEAAMEVLHQVARAAAGRHPIHRDAMEPERMAAAVREAARSPLQ